MTNPAGIVVVPAMLLPVGPTILPATSPPVTAPPPPAHTAGWLPNAGVIRAALGFPLDELPGCPRRCPPARAAAADNDVVDVPGAAPAAPDAVAQNWPT